ncbi:MAG: 7-carboxy-7-deazaguanine synthase QueE [Bacteroidota bacterium]
MHLASLDGKAEIFYTIQGEGKSLGKPSIFVRTSLCNLHCVWCDTDYTWNWKGTRFVHLNDDDPEYQKFDKSEWIKDLSIDEIVKQIEQYPCKNIVVTGGEPLLQQKELFELCRVLKRKGYWIEIETNGTLIPCTALDGLIDQYNVSPKLKNSNNPDKIRVKPRTLKWFAQNKKAILKFVLDSEEDLSEVLQLQTDFKIAAYTIYLMPQGTQPDCLNAKRFWLVEICKQHGFNFTDRLHVQLWGDKKGV